ncbi:hypothetical protein BC835DRAFT_1313287 [Cytidiella melzeri]|nr:hypothetical protein BC835DRAFT_1313287 [Cytidiella melzeri]
MSLLQSCRSPRNIHACLAKTYQRSSSSLSLTALDNWISSTKTLSISDTLHPEHLSDLYMTLPTRDGSRYPHQPPRIGDSLGYGHHLVFFHPRNPEYALRTDGTDADFCPPEPFTRRMWAGGRFDWKLHGQDGLRIGERVNAVSRIKDVQTKGLKQGGTPMVFVKQTIAYSREGEDRVAIEEERSHVYLVAPAHRRAVKEAEELRRLVERGPSFDLEYVPSPTTLFRFSALTFNGHHIHLDRDYARSEGYPERLVHGPLTALMLLELATTALPLQIKSFEYKAWNPIMVNRSVVLNAAYRNGERDLDLWAADKASGTIGMTGFLRRR